MQNFRNINVGEHLYCELLQYSYSDTNRIYAAQIKFNVKACILEYTLIIFVKLFTHKVNIPSYTQLYFGPTLGGSHGNRYMKERKK